jgi:hypothetical protein
MTEVIQIIGRATRDAPGKTHAQFTNLVAEPTNDPTEVADAVNNMLKAISRSLIMEQVLAPNFNFQTRLPDSPSSDAATPGVPIFVRDRQEPSTDRVRQIVKDQLDELKIGVINDPYVQAAIIHPDAFTPAESTRCSYRASSSVHFPTSLPARPTRSGTPFCLTLISRTRYHRNRTIL